MTKTKNSSSSSSSSERKPKYTIADPRWDSSDLRADEFAVIMAIDCWRIAMGQEPTGFPLEEVVRWFNFQLRQLLQADKNEGLPESPVGPSVPITRVDGN